MDPKGHEPAITPVEQKTDNQALAEKLEKISENRDSTGSSTQGLKLLFALSKIL